MIIFGNPIVNVLVVTSLLFPRHARWSLLFMNIVLNWFIVGVFYNNTKSPLDVPEFDTEARNMALDDLWIALISPGVVIVMMYLFAALFRITDQRIKWASTS